MEQKKAGKIFLPFIILFIIINVACFGLANWLDDHKIDHLVLMGANSLLFILTIINLWFFAQAMKKANPNVFVRTVMGTTFVKLLIIAFATLIYFLLSKENKSVYAIIAAMVLYIFYTITEIKAAFKLNRITNAQS